MNLGKELRKSFSWGPKYVGISGIYRVEPINHDFCRMVFRAFSDRDSVFDIVSFVSDRIEDYEYGLG